LRPTRILTAPRQPRTFSSQGLVPLPKSSRTRQSRNFPLLLPLKQRLQIQSGPIPVLDLITPQPLQGRLPNRAQPSQVRLLLLREAAAILRQDRLKPRIRLRLTFRRKLRCIRRQLRQAAVAGAWPAGSAVGVARAPSSDVIAQAGAIEATAEAMAARRANCLLDIAMSAFSCIEPLFLALLCRVRRRSRRG